MCSGRTQPHGGPGPGQIPIAFDHGLRALPIRGVHRIRPSTNCDRIPIAARLGPIPRNRTRPPRQTNSSHIAAGKEICKRFNWGWCSLPDCSFAHTCWVPGCTSHRVPQAPLPVSSPPELTQRYDTPNFDAQVWVSALLHGMQHGFRLGYTGPCIPSRTRNLASAAKHPEAVYSELAKECLAGRVLGPFPTSPLPCLRCSGLGAVPKKDGRWRIILHLCASGNQRERLHHQSRLLPPMPPSTRRSACSPHSAPGR